MGVMSRGLYQQHTGRISSPLYHRKASYLSQDALELDFVLRPFTGCRFGHKPHFCLEFPMALLQRALLSGHFAGQQLIFRFAGGEPSIGVRQNSESSFTFRSSF